ncbi:MAG TPA: response regulator [Anaerolineales bacterium]|jgi:DNA-binding NarL/FixJ family response regulator
MRAILADDDYNVRSALRLLLEKELDLDVTGEVDNSDTLLEEVCGSSPDFILFDWELPGIKVDKLLEMLRKSCPDSYVIGLSGRPGARQAALNAGVDAFVSKGDPPEKVLIALRGLLLENKRN